MAEHVVAEHVVAEHVVAEHVVAEHVVAEHEPARRSARPGTPGQVVFLDDMPWNVAAAAEVGVLAVQVPWDRPGPAVAAARDLLGLKP